MSDTRAVTRPLPQQIEPFPEGARAGLDPLPASTAIQAHRCRTDLLIEIEVIAFIPGESQR